MNNSFPLYEHLATYKCNNKHNIAETFNNNFLSLVEDQVEIHTNWIFALILHHYTLLGQNTIPGCTFTARADNKQMVKFEVDKLDHKLQDILCAYIDYYGSS